MANCVLPEEIIVCIFTRLPVKSIIRFKSVCKPWLSLFSSPQFIKLHRSQFSSDPKNQSRDVLGCCNGLICTVSPTQPRGGLIVLWNPATRLFKSVVFTDTEALGFGYDSEGDDFKLVRITGSRPQKGIYIQEVEVSSFNSDSCTTFEVGFKIRKPHLNAVVVNGNPYWFTSVDDDNWVLICCDVTNLVCKKVPMLPIYAEQNVQPEDSRFVDWNGALGAIVCEVDQGFYGMVATVVDVWVFDDDVWRHKHRFGPIQGCVDIVQCLKNGKMVGKYPNDDLFVFDPVNGCVEAIEMVKLPVLAFEIFDYTESLTHVNGMIRVREEEEEQEEEQLSD